MSDRALLLDMKTCPPQGQEGGIQLFMDGETGTWRLFLTPSYHCVDLSLAMLRDIHRQLGEIIKNIEGDPDTYNAEIRRS